MEEHKVMDQPLASKSVEAPLEVSADVATTSATVPSAENTKKDKIKKSGKMEGKQKAKTAETWIWWGGVLGGLVLVIGGALLMVKVSKLSMQATAGGELGQEKRRNKIESQLPLGNVPIEPC
ncbi:hypothetical protein FRX31_015374 [Thalictrum thalictroides]|uniref:Transmembrane protein n=1 Tax=Thalictrum thalictroides TaxID=46969 RepID=A0A7J6WDH8_THATH|nr:hypothetical protein FRX31_015374 [Thalictrum thalictroides]